MRLVFISNHFPPLVDGVGDYTFHLANEFARNGHEVSVICKEKKEIVDYIKHTNLPFKVYPDIKKWDLYGIKLCYNLIKCINAEWVVLQYVPYGYSRKGIASPILLLVLLSKISGIQWGTFYHEVAPKIKLNSWSFPFHLIQLFVSNLIALFSNVNVTSNDHYRSKFLLAGRINIIPIGSNILPVGLSPSEKVALRGKFVEEGSILLGYFGSNLRKLEKAFDLLRLLVAEGIGTKLMVMGSLNEAKKREFIKVAVEKGVSDLIILTGYLSSEEVFRYLKVCDFYVGFFEGGVSFKSGSVASAFAANLVVVGNAGHLTNKQLINAGNCMLVENMVAKEYLKSILQLINNAKLTTSVKENAKKMYEQHLSWISIYQKYHSLLK